MLKKTACSVALVAALTLFVRSAPAQNYKATPKPAISDYGPFKATTTTKSPATAEAVPAGKCGNPLGDCLFYGGDFLFDPLSANVANGLSNEDTNEVGGTPYGAATWVPFTVPAGQTWVVRGLFTNNESNFGILDQGPTEPVSAAYWAVNENIQPGSAGTTVASGTSAATITPTGRGAFDLFEYTVQVKGLSFNLTPGQYWMTVVPLCTNTSDPYCDEVFFLSDVEYINVTPTNASGVPESTDAAFFDSPFFGLTFDPTNGPLGACAGIGCDAFSAGVLGQKTR
jgi:hypothetical protein